MSVPLSRFEFPPLFVDEPNSETSFSMSSSNCGSANNPNTYKALRISAIFIILATSLFGTIFPVVSKRRWKIPTFAFDFIKYFGSGVIVSSSYRGFASRHSFLNTEFYRTNSRSRQPLYTCLHQLSASLVLSASQAHGRVTPSLPPLR